MYTSYIGKKFLKYYNEEYNKNYTAEEFFDELMLPLFFNDTRHLMHVGNSPFFQTPSKKEIEKCGSKFQLQLSNFKEKIESDNIDGGIYVGYGSGNIAATTSGQMSDLNTITTKEELYLSWIGQGFSIGVKGGTCILIDNKSILLDIYSGWNIYSKFIEQTPDLKDKQIETWNGNYISLLISGTNKTINTSDIDTAVTMGKLAIQTIEWTKLLFLFSKRIGTESVIVYCYSLSQTNQTFGFLNIYLDKFGELYELRDKYFIDGNKSVLSDKQIEELIPFYNFSNACKLGAIGLKSLEPRGLRKYLPKSSYIYSQGKEINKDKEENYYLYKLWILAMLNKKELLELSRSLADVLVKIQNESDGSDRATTKKKNILDGIFEARSIKEFVSKITEINTLAPKAGVVLREVVENVVEMPKDNFPLFITLIKFEYYNIINK